MESSNARLEAFCDGIFAIAITLLILEIKVPPIASVHTRHELWMAFGHAWPSWVAFLLSFLIILIAWVNHWNGSKLLNRSTPKFIYANGLVMLSVVVMPFPLAAAAEFLDFHNMELAQPPITLYCAAVLFSDIAWYILLRSILYPESLLKPNISFEKVKKVSKNLLVAIVLYASTFILSFWFPLIAFSIVALSFVIWLLVGISLKEENMTIDE